MGVPMLVTLLSTIVLGRLFIPLFKRIRFHQTVRDNGPKSHLAKTGTPTMGGLFFLLPVLTVSMIFSEDRLTMLAMLLAVLGFAGIGFADDVLKIRRKSKDGLTVLEKTIAQLSVALAYACYIVLLTPGGAFMLLPVGGLNLVQVNIPPYLYIPFLVLFLYLVTNSVNLTDGLDGLCGGVTTLVMLLFLLISLQNVLWREAGLLSAAVVGGLLGFLAYNAHPARVFMGDVGSLGLGGIVGVVSIHMGIPWIILVAGIIYVVEALSVIIQVGWYKKTKKRVFRMAPIHHHFELTGWSEKKIVLIFCTVTLIGCLISLVLLGWF